MRRKEAGGSPAPCGGASFSYAPGVEYVVERRQVVPVSLEEAFAFFADPWNLEAITPPWLGFRVVEAPQRLARGSRLLYRLRLFGLPVTWSTEIVDWRPPRTFTDRQLSGPYPLWEHAHRLNPVPGGTEIFDLVRYRLHGGLLAPLVGRLFVRGRLDRIFDYRAQRLRELLG
jgi:ligand-binding SRPBCC domain-containing protein